MLTQAAKAIRKQEVDEDFSWKTKEKTRGGVDTIKWTRWSF